MEQKLKSDGVSILLVLFFIVTVAVCITAIITIVAKIGKELVKKRKVERGGSGEERKLIRKVDETVVSVDRDDITDLLYEERMKQILSEEIKRAATDELVSAAFERVLNDSSWLSSPVTASDIDDAISDSSASHIFERTFNAHLSSAISEKVEDVIDERIRRLRPFLRPTTFAVDITAYDTNRPQPEDVAGALDNFLKSAHADDTFLPTIRYVSEDDFTAATSPESSSIEHGLHMLFEKSTTTILRNREKYDVSITVFNNLGYEVVMYGTVYCNGPGVQFNTLKTEPGQNAFGVPVRGFKSFMWKINSARRPIFNKLFFSFLVYRTST